MDESNSLRAKIEQLHTNNPGKSFGVPQVTAIASLAIKKRKRKKLSMVEKKLC